MERQTVLNALHRGTPLAAELSCADPQRRAWVGVYPLDLSTDRAREFVRNLGVDVFPLSGRAYHVRSFEVDRLESTQDVYIGETDLVNKRSCVAFSDDVLDEQLKAFGSSLEDLQPHHKSDYPI
jgi:hypothetical protein